MVIEKSKSPLDAVFEAEMLENARGMPSFVSDMHFLNRAIPAKAGIHWAVVAVKKRVMDSHFRGNDRPVSSESKEIKGLCT